MLQGWLQIALFLVVLVALTPLIGGYMARVYTNERVFLTPSSARSSGCFYRVMRVDPARGQDWKGYARSLLVLLGPLLARAVPDPAHPDAAPVQPAGLPLGHLGRDLQHRLVVHHEHELAVLRRRDDDVATSARWPGWRCRTSSPPAVGICVAVALIRGHRLALGARASATSGRTSPARCSTCCCRSPSSARCCSSRRASIQNFAGYATAHTLTGGTQTIAFGPVASQEIIKELGTNGGGFFNVNSAMPFENPSGLSNFLEMLAILLIPAGLTATYGRMVGNRRQGWAIFSAMTILFVIGVAVVYAAEQHGTPAQHLAGVHATPARRRTSRARSSASGSPTPRSGPRSPR